MSNARDALFNRIQSMHNTIGGLRQREDANARMAVDGDDETLQTYGYAGALKERKEALEDEMSQQMQQMALQQQMLQQQLAAVAGMNSGALCRRWPVAGVYHAHVRAPAHVHML